MQRFDEHPAAWVGPEMNNGPLPRQWLRSDPYVLRCR